LFCQNEAPLPLPIILITQLINTKTHNPFTYKDLFNICFPTIGLGQAESEKNQNGQEIIRKA
jgi:hypothetical protein